MTSSSSSTNYAPATTAPGFAELAAFLDRCQRLLVITGAGLSTGSGIPDYRDDQGQWKRKPPVQLQDFLRQPATRRRYWARATVGWPHFVAAQPNAAHQALAALEAQGRLLGVITQNVDGLHQRAGSRQVIDLHGRLDQVACLSCHSRRPREAFHQVLLRLNPHLATLSADQAPDGDADLDWNSDALQVPVCQHCGGLLKPDVVFFGESVPAARVQACYDWVDAADGVLVVGSSLQVFSGFRFVRRAHERGLPIAALNRGATRADALLSLKAQGDCAQWLPALIPTAAPAPPNIPG